MSVIRNILGLGQSEAELGQLAEQATAAMVQGRLIEIKTRQGRHGSELLNDHLQLKIEAEPYRANENTPVVVRGFDGLFRDFNKMADRLSWLRAPSKQHAVANGAVGAVAIGMAVLPVLQGYRYSQATPTTQWVIDRATNKAKSQCNILMDQAKLDLEAGQVVEGTQVQANIKACTVAKVPEMVNAEMEYASGFGIGNCAFMTVGLVAYAALKLREIPKRQALSRVYKLAGQIAHYNMHTASSVALADTQQGLVP